MQIILELALNRDLESVNKWLVANKLKWDENRIYAHWIEAKTENYFLNDLHPYQSNAPHKIK